MARPTVQIPTITIGTRLTDYGALDLIVEGLAAGGMGLVVWGRNAARGNQMQALKLLHPDRLTVAAARSPEHRRAIERQFEDEALVWCHLWAHQCVVSATGLLRLPAQGNLPVLELAYAPNGSLRDLLRRGRAERGHPSLLAALAWAVHIASALAHMHQPDPAHERPAPLVHCDLKPENVLLNSQNWAQLTDLGLTRAYAALVAESASAAAPTSTSSGPVSGVNAHQVEVARLRAVLQAAGALPPDAPPAVDEVTLLATRTLCIPSSSTAAAPTGAVVAIGSRGAVAGSPPYMAPEQWLGLDAVVPATDVYAFGVLLYELFAGTEAPHPFPFDPTSYLTPQIYAHAQATGYDPGLLAWHAAHTAPAGPTHRLTDLDVTEAALRSGPLANLYSRGDTANQRTAHIALQQLDALIHICLAHDIGARPSATELQHRLVALAHDPCGLTSDDLPLPAPLNAIPHNEAAFWGNLGNTYSRLNRHEEAAAAQRRAAQLDPDDPNHWLNLGATLGRLGQEERREELVSAASGRSTQASTLAAAAREHFEEALAAFKQAETHLTPQAIAEIPALPAEVAGNQGAALRNLGRYAEAVAAYQRDLAFLPDDHTARFNLALAYAHWSQVREFHATPSKRIEHLQAAQREIEIVLADAPNYNNARALAELIARALADPAHRFVG